MVLHKPNIVACILFVLFGISALLIVVAVMLQLDRPSLADTQAVASYSKHESRASGDAEGRITKQESSRSQEDSVADTTPTEPSASSPASGTVEETLDLAKPERPVANHASEIAGNEPDETPEKLTKISGKSPRKLPTWNFRIGAPIFYRPSPESDSAASESGDSALGAKPVCRTLGRSSGNGRVVFPLPGEYLNSYEDTWGAARVQGAHEGTDLMAPEGTPEYALTDGTLVPVSGANGDGWNTLGGYTVMLRADYDMGPIRAGDLFYYAHMREESALPIGTHVRAGQILGYAGDTGQGPEITRGLFPPHLHLGWYDTTGLRTNLPSGAMNPYPLLQWLKSNGGLISGGSGTRYCEAPQSEQPVPSTGSNVWPSSSSPGTMPDLATGTGNAKPSPVADRKVHASERTLDHPETTRHRHAHNPVKPKVVENARPDTAGARGAPASSRRVSSPQEDRATVKRSHHTVQKTGDRLSWRNREIRVIFHQVEERIGSLDRGRIRNTLHGRIGGWSQPQSPASPQENEANSDSKQEKKHAGSARKHRAQPEKDHAGKDGATRPEPADESRESDEPSKDETTTCDTVSTGSCQGTNEEPSVSGPEKRNTDAMATTAVGTEPTKETTSAAPDKTNPEAVETGESTSMSPSPESSETGESTIPEPGTETSGG